MRENHGDTEFTEFLSGLSPWPSCLGSENLQSAGEPSEFKQNWRLKSATGDEIHESHFHFSEWTDIMPLIHELEEFVTKNNISYFEDAKVKYHHQRWWLEVLHLEGAMLLS